MSGGKAAAEGSDVAGSALIFDSLITQDKGTDMDDMLAAPARYHDPSGHSGSLSQSQTSCVELLRSFGHCYGHPGRYTIICG